MKTGSLYRLRRQLAADAPVFGLWITLESPSITEMAVALAVSTDPSTPLLGHKAFPVELGPLKQCA